MKNKRIVLLAFFVLIVALLAISTFAQSNLPPSIQKIIDSNLKITTDFAVNVSFFIAFIAGMLGILSPCILPFLPAYFSYTFKEKKNITRMTLVFFLGFSLVFVIMGAIAGFIGEQTLLAVQQDWLIVTAGIFMLIMGALSLRGKKVCSYIHLGKCKDDTPGTFLFGIFFALGWTACLGPILAGILGIGAILGNIWYSALLMLFYSLGNLVPLFVLSMFYDKFKLSESKFIQGKILEFSIAKKKYYIHSTNLISGVLFFAIGLTLLIYQGTGIFNTWDIFGTKQYFYSVQRWLIAWQYANILGIVLLVLFVIILARFLLKYKSNNSR